jgi:hypothetical protein
VRARSCTELGHARTQPLTGQTLTGSRVQETCPTGSYGFVRVRTMGTVATSVTCRTDRGSRTAAAKISAYDSSGST